MILILNINCLKKILGGSAKVTKPKESEKS